MGNYKYTISKQAYNKISSFYKNVAKKYYNTYSYQQMQQNIEETKRAIFQIENGLIRRNPTIKRWAGYYMATTKSKKNKQWNFAYKIQNNTIYVVDACHSQNMHDNLNFNIYNQQLYESIMREVSKIVKMHIKQL